jgi:uncharacterized membrane protein
MLRMLLCVEKNYIVMSQIEATLSEKPSYRINTIDLLRGLVMVIMALDHTRDFFHKDAWTQDPLDLKTTTAFLYFTRWITHFCAPVFVFLAGAGAFFQSQRKTRKELSSFLIKRGLWLIIVEVVIIGFAFTFDVTWSAIGLQTIWAIGVSMIILGFVIWLPFTAIFGVGLLIVLGHNSLDYYEDTFEGSGGLFYDLLHQPGFHRMGNFDLLIMYPFLSWSGLMILGYCFGKLFISYDGDQRQKILAKLGVTLLVLFVGLRLLNIYGDPDQWYEQKSALYTFFSFMDVEKYPPSLLYMCATIGPAILFLAFVKRASSGVAKFITVFGRVPFFYYVLHFFLLHILSSLAYLSRGHSLSEGLNNGDLPKFIAPGEGYSLWVVYLVWIAVVLLLYPLCKWFSNYKMKHRDKWWLSYL